MTNTTRHMPQPTQARPSRLAARLLSDAWAPRWLAVLVVIGIALRLWLISFTPLDASYSTADDGDYYQRAFRFAVTGQYIDDGWLIRPPLHTMFFAFWIRVGLLLGQPLLGITLIQLAQTVLGGLNILLGYGIARRLFANARAGLLFAAFHAVWFPFVEQPSVLFSELLYLFLFQLHYWLLLRFDANNRYRDLALSGLALGAAALTRSPALYSLAFVAIWMFFRPSTQSTGTLWQQIWQRFIVALRPTIAIALCCIVIVAPWTIRNYITYQSFIPIDTLGQINLWLDLDAVDQRNVHIAELRNMPQAERAGYAMARAREILAADPLRPFNGISMTFLHIWKAQYIEDFFIKQSFFTRPLRETAALGLFGDLLWFVYTLAGLVVLAGRPREGWHNRLFVLAWLAYSLVTVLVFHVEPRYLLPIWTLIALYGAGGLAQLRSETFAGPRWVQALQGAAALAFVVLVVSYRNYPQVLSTGFARERAIIAGERAYAQNDYIAAERHFREALAAQPNFVDAKISLALALDAQGRLDEARAVIAEGGARRADLLRGALAVRAGEPQGMSSLLTRVEASAGEDIQAWALASLRSPAIRELHLGDWRDIGYIAGFNRPEQAPDGTFRWLRDRGKIAFHVDEPFKAGDTIVLRLAGGQPGETPLTIRIGETTYQINVLGGMWRSYHLPVPDHLIGQQYLALDLQAPAFVPAYIDPNSDDLRVLSVRVSDIRID